MSADSASAPLEQLGAAGVAEPAELWARFGALWPDAPAPAQRALLEAADPELAVASLARVREAAPAAWAPVGADPMLASRLLTALGASPFVTRLLIADPTDWVAVLWPDGADIASVVPPPAAVPFAELLPTLRRFRRRRARLIAVRDLLGDASLEETMTQLTRLAEDALEAAVTGVRHDLEARHGRLQVGDRPLGFCVLGFGKLGGVELNFSSDVDLMYLYECDGPVSTGGPDGALSAREFSARLAEGVTRAMQQATDDGLVFRVDLRLRPEGTNGPLVNSLANMLSYYESWGVTWERAALLKARPVAGARALGHALLGHLEPFVYRRFLDFQTVADIKEMKGRVEAALAASGSRGTNVKLGEGGIREVEFVVQTLQLVHAGKDARIRTRGTLAALARLGESRYLRPADAQALAGAYRFLRDVEHKIQLEEDRQTHVIPSGAAERRLARRLGFGREAPAEAVARFRAACDGHRKTVHAAFTALLYASRDAIAHDTDRRMVDLVAHLDDAAQARAGLAALGFRDPDVAVTHLRLLRDGPRPSPARPRRRQLLVELAPALLQEIAAAPDPDAALRTMADFLAAVGGRTSFLALLAENRPTMAVLVRLFGSSEFLSRLLVRHPEMLDSLVRADLVRHEVGKEDMVAELASQLDAAEGYEDRLEAMRRFRHEHFLRIGVADLEGVLPLPTVSGQLSDVADVCLDAAWRVGESETLRRFGLARAPGRFVVVGMGKLGARELTYNSDLDLIFVYVAAADDGGTVPVHEFFTRLAQTMMTTLQVQTREGSMYKIDTRLRPSGNAGPLVSSLDAFARYHAESSQLWERQALVKARPVAGDPSLMREVETIIERFVYGSSLDDAQMVEIHRIRMRMERELAGSERTEFNVKTGRGGIVDVEFLVQMLQLRHGAEHPAVRQRATRRALAALRDAHLLPAEDATTLERGYEFLRSLTNRLRIERDQPVEAIEREGDRLTTLARRLGYTGDDAGQRLLDDYTRHRERIRALYARWFEVAAEIDNPQAPG